jgi:hypothetical protein
MWWYAPIHCVISSGEITERRQCTVEGQKGTESMLTGLGHIAFCVTDLEKSRDFYCLSPRNGVLRFPSHDKRKTRTPYTEQRWDMEKTIWEVVGGERK